MVNDVSEQSPDDIDPLTRIAIRCGTDKWGQHFYTPVYHQLFSHLRDKPLRLLEIGVGGYNFLTVGGASLAMWADYFPNGQIVGVDIAEKKLDLPPRVQFRRGSQDDPAFLRRVSEELGPFDIVIDDGSHVPKHIAATFNTLFPLVRDGGLYVIEDVQTTFWPNFGGSIFDGGGTMALARTILDFLHHAEIKAVQPQRQIAEMAKTIRSFRAYHNMFVIEKGDNTEPSSAHVERDDPHARRAIRAIENELAQAPTAAGYANFADVLVWTGQLERANAILNEGLERWPNQADLLVVAARLAQDPLRKCGYIAQLARLDPGNAELQNMLQKAERAAAAVPPRKINT